MNDDINKYTVQLTKSKNVVSIFILNEYEFIEEFYYASFDQHINKYYIFGSLTEFASEVLLCNNIIEQIDLEFCPKFTLTKNALIPLL